MAGGGGEEGEFGLQIAPMLDVMFVLLLFFMVSAGAVMKESELGVNVPGVSKAAAPGQMVPITIDIAKDGAVSANKLPMDSPTNHELPSLRAKLKATVELDAKQSVIIRPAADVPHERLVDVLNACSWAKVTQLSFAGG